MNAWKVSVVLAVLIAYMGAVQLDAQTTTCTVTGTAQLGPFRIPISGTCSELVGPPGPAGPQGVPGPAGPPGPAGSSAGVAFTTNTAGATTLAGSCTAGSLTEDTTNGVLYVCQPGGTWSPFGTKLAVMSPGHPQLANCYRDPLGHWTSILPVPLVGIGWQRGEELGLTPGSWQYADPRGTYRAQLAPPADPANLYFTDCGVVAFR